MPGTIDDRSVAEVQPTDLSGFARVHLFAGVGGWELSLQYAGWQPTRPVWTASCPCPPFSSAGKRTVCPACEGEHPVWHPGRTGCAVCALCGHEWLADPRHLWPEVWRLASECRPAIIYGEQVASPDGVDWFSGVRGSLEILSYAAGASDLPSAGNGAWHKRQRLYWMADAHGRDASAEGLQRGGEYRQRQADAGARRLDEPEGERRDGRRTSEPSDGGTKESQRCGDAGRLGDADCGGRPSGQGAAEETRHRSAVGPDGGMGQSLGEGLEGQSGHGDRRDQPGRLDADPARPATETGAPCGLGDAKSGDQWRPWESRTREGPEGAARGSGAWREVEWLPCTDGKWRPTQPGIFPLAHAIPARVGRLRAYGNAIDPILAAEFIAATDRLGGP